MPEPVLPSTARLLLARTARVQREGRAPSLVAGVVRDGGLAWSAGRGEVRRAAHRRAVPARVDQQDRHRRRRDAAARRGAAAPRRPPRGAPARHPAGRPDRRAAALAPRRRLGREPGRLVGAHARGHRSTSSGSATTDVVLGAARRFHYSNLGFGLLGELVARMRGTSWEDAVTAEVLRPLGMDRTSPRPVQPAAGGHRGAPVGRRRPARAGARRRGDGRRRAAVGVADRPRPLRRLPARRHRRRARPRRRSRR